MCWHKWGKWSDVIKCFRGSQHQVRKCDKCGAITSRVAIHIRTAQLNPEQVTNALKGKQ